MGDRYRSTINTSPSKHQFSFSKSSRFPKPKAYTNAFGYQVPETFGSRKSSGPAFNSSAKKM
jgi:hypothetical protein